MLEALLPEEGKDDEEMISRSLNLQGLNETKIQTVKTTFLIDVTKFRKLLIQKKQKP